MLLSCKIEKIICSENYPKSPLANCEGLKPFPFYRGMNRTPL